MKKKTLAALVLTLSFAAPMTFAQSTDIGSSGSTRESAKCSISIDAARSVLNPDNTADNEAQFLRLSRKALSDCRKNADNWPKLRQYIDLGSENCRDIANQGMSQLFHGTCLLKVADSAQFLLGPMN